ncbi:hypothetical protein E2562_005553 [Oryza meyeriana var. granulata]|uniref:Late embryogenesis abundant protein LEA-2 subgroup domain-containing protein n=1 Tax=Oryza meyeriana var. granulata TaxID=110450 RepID=A0A6G1F3U7_9ORYZ|nr:hypothetical protein E2562_005553 [Oryza meyeriana var. granulata]
MMRPDEEEQVDVRRCVCIYCAGFAVAVILAAVGALTWYVYEITTDPQYSVEIGAVAGLDPATDLLGGKAAFSPAFNLTVALASSNSLRGACVKPGASVSVTYACLDPPLATGLVPDFCVGPRESREELVVAGGVNVSVPGYLLPSLADGMRSGQVIFELNLVTEDRWGGCRMRVGEKASCHTAIY